MNASAASGLRGGLLREAASAWFRYRVLQPLRRRPLPPRAMHMLPTYRCNARCVMCGIWRDPRAAGGELSLAQCDRMLADRLFAGMEFVGISGGEPFLRADLPALVRLLQRRCPRLKRVSLTTNGLLPDRIAPALSAIVADCRRSGTLLDVSVSLHGLGERLARVYGTTDTFERIEDTVEDLKRRRAAGELTLSFNSVLLRDNLEEAPALARWAEERGVPISFVIGEMRDRFHNREQADVFLDEASRPRLVEFLHSQARGVSLRHLLPLRYRELIRVLEGHDRRSPCYYAMGGLVLGHDGQLYYCSHSRSIGNAAERSAWDLYYAAANLDYRRRELLGRECRRCPPYTLTRWEIEAHAPAVAWALLRERWHAVLARGGRGAP